MLNSFILKFYWYIIWKITKDKQTFVFILITSVLHFFYRESMSVHMHTYNIYMVIHKMCFNDTFAILIKHLHVSVVFVLKS